MMMAFTLIFGLQAAQTQLHPEMTGEGWVFMAAAWLFILSLTLYTFGKILKKK
jgi:hypothetical protein